MDELDKLKVSVRILASIVEDILRIDHREHMYKESLDIVKNLNKK